jgi:hypothetical protein
MAVIVCDDPVMAHRGLAIGVIVVVLIAACGSHRSPRPSQSARNAELTAHQTEAHGDGYRRADQPEAIADLVEHYAVKNGGEVLAREVQHGSRPGGHVDVLFHLEGGGWESDVWECWRFSFLEPDGDAYVREIKFNEIRCPAGATPRS